MPPTLILSTCRTDDSQKLWRAATNAGWNIEYLEGYRVPEHLKSVKEPVIYVPALLAPMVAEELGIRLVEPADNWLVKLPFRFRQRFAELTSMSEARRINIPLFMKPPNDKSFKASICVGDDLPKEYPDTDPVLIQEPVKWLREYRVFVMNRVVMGLSIYLRNGELQKDKNWEMTEEEEQEVLNFLDRLLINGNIISDDAMVIDVGEIEGRGWAVVEANAAWGSGCYGCDCEGVLQVMRAAMLRDS